MRMIQSLILGIVTHLTLPPSVFDILGEDDHSENNIEEFEMEVTMLNFLHALSDMERAACFWFLILCFFSFKSSQSDASSGPELWSEIVDTGLQRESTEFVTVQVFTFFILLWQASFKVANIAVTMLFHFFPIFFFTYPTSQG